MTATTSATSIAAPTPTGNPAPPPAGDADSQGFTAFRNGARCFGTDKAEMFMRTKQSALVVCRSEVNRLYYRGYRISDGATIDVYDVSRQTDGFVATDAPDNARYVITSDGFQLIQDGTVVVSETAVETGPVPGVQTPTTQAASTIVLGSASDMGPNSLGYGTEQPSVISMGSCPNAISQIVWQDWGAAVAHGSGLGCVEYGPQPRYQLVASGLGMCHGVMAYRALQIASTPEEIYTADLQHLCDK
ncbi:hypothetical protein [Antrihabitans stalactiti]|uniref:Uncharacterized protein n=1 Tax=Antrihabitans stalactiti TaxID=2584121 RepID=A0A848KGL0_9NOCA|nr:hypothetical protein [Antrihabitans stalactiti]NMN95057.1 hypothetical protein [Antrihabitans stalactiti]